MLFPGAIYFVAVFLAFVSLCFSIAVGFLGGAFFSKVSELIIRRTDVWKELHKGRDIPWPWWAHAHRWFFPGWVITSIITLYCLAGPWVATIQLLGDL